MSIEIQVNDRVHARFYNSDRSQVAIQDFNVTSIEGTTYKGGAIDCDTSEGWEIELTAKNFANLNLPDMLSEITAYNAKGAPTYLTGKGLVWRDENGIQYGLEKVFSWENGHVTPSSDSSIVVE